MTPHPNLKKNHPRGMASSDSESCSDDSREHDDPNQSSGVPKYLWQLRQHTATERSSLVDGSLEKKFDEQDGQSHGRDAARTSKLRRRFSVSPNKRGDIVVPASDSDSDCDSVASDALCVSPDTRKRGIRRPCIPWTHIKQWKLSEYANEVVYEEIKAIMQQSLDNAGPKVFVQPNSSAIAGFRLQKVRICSLMSAHVNKLTMSLLFMMAGRCAPATRGTHSSVCLSVC
jgi:hypothetical protein